MELQLSFAQKIKEKYEKLINLSRNENWCFLRSGHFFSKITPNITFLKKVTRSQKASIFIDLDWWVFNIFLWFFVQKKAEVPYFSNQKFFTPLKSFLPPVFHSKTPHKIKNFTLFNRLGRHLFQKRGVKKLSRRVKNFWS